MQKSLNYQNVQHETAVIMIVYEVETSLKYRKRMQSYAETLLDQYIEYNTLINSSTKCP